MSADLRPNPNDTPEQAAAKLHMRQAVQDHIEALEARQAEEYATKELIREVVREELRLAFNDHRLRKQKEQARRGGGEVIDVFLMADGVHRARG